MSAWRLTDHVTACTACICTCRLKFVFCRTVCSRASTPELSLVGAVTVCSPLPFFSISLPLSVMLSRLPTHGAGSGRRLLLSGKAPLAGALSLYVRQDFGASQKTEPYRTDTTVFSPKPNRNRPT